MNKFLSPSLLAMLALTTVLLLATKDNARNLPPDSSSGKAAIGGSFMLTNQDGKVASDAEFRGKNMLVFFGFTRCPMICPTTIATLSNTLGLLGDKANAVAPIFISIDPAHDTPENIKTYLANFDPRIVGLTGSEEQIKAVTSAYKAYYSSQNDTMDHSSLIYWMDSKGEYISHFPYDIAAEELTKKLLEGLQK